MNHLKLGKCRENWGLGSKQMWRYLSKEMPPSPVEISCRDFARCAQKAFKLCAFGNQCIRKLVNSLPTGKCQPTDTQSGRVMKSWNHRLEIPSKAGKQTTNTKTKHSKHTTTIAIFPPERSPVCRQSLFQSPCSRDNMVSLPLEMKLNNVINVEQCIEWIESLDILLKLTFLSLFFFQHLPRNMGLQEMCWPAYAGNEAGSTFA